MANFLVNIIVQGLTILRWALIIALLVTLFGMILPYLSNVGSYHYLQPIIAWESYINQLIKSYIPTKVAGWDLSRLITLIAILISIDLTKTFSEKLQFIKQKHRMLKELKRIQQAYKSPNQKDKIALLESKMEQASLASGKNRKELLKDFAHIKKELEKIGRDLAFLSIDVVDSTGMKQGEDPTTIELDFIEYHNFVEAKFKDHGLIKASWTPDGVMACFNTIEEAVQAAQSILNELEYFNRNVKSMKRDFVIRCGVNGGHVYYDDSIPLEQFSDRVIDIAGHMQKHAPSNSILIAKQAIEPVKNREHFTATKRIVDGLEVCEWIKVKVNEKT
ncbi:MAG: adenylate/guanylate cyclase domain-containing protein [Gammaproteobacteria bacterium]|nr:adenylate/guanylate cyclase domain-containing protein [Gammaproteobacteria bacterium]MCW5583663.1 adenylate/guanylate cyclase domain-containing protein [Gammaproteobacteria bacterium]